MSRAEKFWGRVALAALLGLIFLLVEVLARAELPSPTGYGLNIARRSDGLHALPFWNDGNGACLWIWTNRAEEGRSLKLEGWSRFIWPSGEFCEGDRFTAIDSVPGYSSGRVTTWSLADGHITEDFLIGDGNTRWGASCAMSSGGLAFIAYQHVYGQIISFDLAYRRPTTPPTPEPTALPAWPWQTNRYTVPAFNGSIPSANFSMCQLGGLLYVFVTRDSSHCVALFRFKEVDGKLLLNDFDTAFIAGFPTNGIFDPLAPHGEFPPVSARSDPDHGRVIFMYEGAYDALAYVCGGDNYYARPIIGAVYPDLRKELILRSPYYSERIIGLSLFARPDGPYRLQEVTDVAACDWKYWFITPGGRVFPLDVDGEPASSPDGWLAFGSSIGFQIVPPHFAPRLTIARTTALTGPQVMELAAKVQANPNVQAFIPPQNVSLSGWDGSATIEDSTNLKQWQVNRTSSAPALIMLTNQQQFFRLKTP